MITKKLFENKYSVEQNSSLLIKIVLSLFNNYKSLEVKTMFYQKESAILYFLKIFLCKMHLFSV